MALKKDSPESSAPKEDNIDILYDVHRRLCDAMSSNKSLVRSFQKKDLVVFYKEYCETLNAYTSIIDELYRSNKIEH